MAIVLKSAHRPSSVSRSAIREAVSAVYSTNGSAIALASPQTATVTKRTATRNGSLKSNSGKKLKQ